MNLHDRHHHHHHRPGPISLPPRVSSPRLYPPYSFPPTPTPTPSKRRSSSASSPLFLSSLFLLLASLQPLYSILPFLQSTSSPLSLFPFFFLVSLLSFSLSLLFYSLSSSKSAAPIFPLFPAGTHLVLPSLAAKSTLLALSFFLRFQSLRSCGTGPTILAEFSGSLAAQFASSRAHHSVRSRYVRGFAALLLALILLSCSWDRAACFPFNGFQVNPALFSGNCIRVATMALPFLSGLVGYYEKSSSNWAPLRQLGRRRVRLISLLLTTVVLFVPAVVSFYTVENVTIFAKSLVWPLLNTVVFGVILSENCTDNKLISIRDLRRDFAITFVCTIVLELFYFPELSLFGFLLCGFLLWVSVRDLGSQFLNYPEIGFDSSETFSSLFWNPIRHILSERKSRKIALFLMINTAYMVVEFVAGFMSNSLGLISDACHMLFDCAALAIGLYASYISRLPANNQFNYGRGRFEVLSGYVNAVLLVLVGALIVLESFERILDPQEISTNSLLSVSIGGLLVNMVGLIFFHEEHHHAHGGGGACTHSHHHENHLHHHHHHHDHHHDAHDHDHGHQNIISVNSHLSDEKSSNSHHHGHNHDSHEAYTREKLTSDLQNLNSCSELHNHKHQKHDSHLSSDQSCEKATNKQEVHCCEHHHEEGDHSHHIQPQVGHEHHAEDLLLGAKSGKEARKHSHVDHNMEGIFLHVLADTMGSVGVVISTLLIKYKGWLVADPACSIFISVLIISSVISLLRNSAEILLQRLPRSHENDINLALDDVMNLRGIQSVQNVHVWNLTNTDLVGTLHLHISAATDRESCKKQVLQILSNEGIKDITLQVENVKVT